MIITLLDGNSSYADVEYKERKNSTTYWCQTGFTELKRCCVSRYLICKDGRVYGRIATELVPAGQYDGYEYTIDDNSSLAKSIKYRLNKLQEA